MPDGHCFDMSRGAMTFDEALADLNTKGVASLKRADGVWREYHAPDTGMADNGEVRHGD